VVGIYVAGEKEFLDDEPSEQAESSPCNSALYIGSPTSGEKSPASSRHFIDVDLHVLATSGGGLLPQMATVAADGVKDNPHSPSFSPVGTTESTIAVAGVPVVACAVALKVVGCDSGPAEIGPCSADMHSNTEEREATSCDDKDVKEFSCMGEVSMALSSGPTSDEVTFEDAGIARFSKSDASAGGVDSVVSSGSMTEPEDAVETNASFQTCKDAEPDAIVVPISITSQNLFEDVSDAERDLASSAVSLAASKAVLLDGIREAVKPTDVCTAATPPAEAAPALETRCSASAPSSGRARTGWGCWSCWWQPCCGNH